MIERLQELRLQQDLPTTLVRERLLASPDVSVVFRYPYEHGVDAGILAQSHELELREAYQELIA